MSTDGPLLHADEVPAVRVRRDEVVAGVTRLVLEHDVAVRVRRVRGLTTHQVLRRGAWSVIAASSLGLERGGAGWWEGSRRSRRRSARTSGGACRGSTRRSGTAWPC